MCFTRVVHTYVFYWWYSPRPRLGPSGLTPASLDLSLPPLPPPHAVLGFKVVIVGGVYSSAVSKKSFAFSFNGGADTFSLTCMREFFVSLVLIRIRNQNPTVPSVLFSTRRNRTMLLSSLFEFVFATAGD